MGIVFGVGVNAGRKTGNREKEAGRGGVTHVVVSEEDRDLVVEKDDQKEELTQRGAGTEGGT